MASLERGFLVSSLKTLRLILGTPKLLLHRDPVRYYEYLGDDVVEGEHGNYRVADKPLWLNLGYWESAQAYPDAAAALATQLADAAELGPDDELLDVGFGFAEQDFLWLRKYGPRRITGINITPVHVERAQARAVQLNLQDRLDLRVGSATELPFEPSSFDKVTALESAHHFDTREKFFAEAFRVLRPGGRLALADGIPLPGHDAPSLAQRIVLKRWSYPLANFYDREEYVRKLEAAGFVDAGVRSIREFVYPGIHKYGELRRKGVSMAEAVVHITAEDREKGLRAYEALGVPDYALFWAKKPL